MAPHHHDHHHGHHDHDHGQAPGRALRWALVFTLGYALVEAAGGWWADSLALLGDAGHMFSDAVALGLAAAASWFSTRPPSARHSYGLLRAEVIAALVNGLLMLVVVIGIGVEAVERLNHPQPVAGGTVFVVAFVGLVINVAVALILSQGGNSLNTRAALLHVLGDLLGSVAALLAGAVIHFTGWTPIDPILSLLICALILNSTLRLLREALHVLMEGVPLELDLNEIGRRLAAIPRVVSVHDLHVWTLSSGLRALSAHVVLADMRDWMPVLAQMQRELRQHYAIEHVTLQPEPAGSGFQPAIPIYPSES